MKLTKSLILSTFLSLWALNGAQAQTQNQPKQAKPQSKQTQTKAQKQQAQKKQAQKKQTQQVAPKTLNSEEALKQFNEAFNIRFVGRQFNLNQRQLTLRYELTNKSKKDIHEVKFISAFTHNDQIIYAQEIPLTFHTPLKAQNAISLDISVPLEKIPTGAQPILANQQLQVGIINGAQLLTFTDKTALEIK